MKSGYQTNVKNVAEIVPIATKSTQINVKKLKLYLSEGQSDKLKS